MSDSEIRRRIDSLIDTLLEEVQKQKAEAGRHERNADALRELLEDAMGELRRSEGIADNYWRQLVAMQHERDHLKLRVNEYEAMACAHPACHLRLRQAR